MNYIVRRSHLAFSIMGCRGRHVSSRCMGGGWERGRMGVEGRSFSQRGDKARSEGRRDRDKCDMDAGGIRSTAPMVKYSTREKENCRTWRRQVLSEQTSRRVIGIHDELSNTVVSQRRVESYKSPAYSCFIITGC